MTLRCIVAPINKDRVGKEGGKKERGQKGRVRGNKEKKKREKGSELPSRIRQLEEQS